MFRVLSVSVAALLVLSFVTVLPFPQSAYSQALEKGPFIDQARFIQYTDESVALQEIKSGNIDAYFFRIPSEIVQDSRDDQRIKIYEKIAGSSGILINPAPSPDSNSINPFSLKDVRFAMNYLIDREFIVNEVMKGDGVALVDPFGVYSPDYQDVIESVESFGIRYNPTLANSLIESAMTEAGATKEDGKWTYSGSPVSVKILIRSDDPARSSIGEIISSSLEDAGFTVQKDFGDLFKANTIVYGSDPQSFQWHLYTEGFAGTSTFVKDNPLTLGQMYAPWQGALPGSQNPEFWNYQNTTLDELTQKLFFFQFGSESERDELQNQALRMGMQEAVRLFLVQKIEAYVTSSDVTGWVNDFGAGITSKYSLINAMPATGSSVDVGVKQIYQGAWNAIGGYNDAYNRDIFFLIYDSPTFRHPFTADIVEVRNQWIEVVTDGPEGKLDVPDEAQMWNSTNQMWESTGDMTAKSKVSNKLVYSNWHHGIPMDKSDILYSQYFGAEWATDGEGDFTNDPDFTPAAKAALALSKGVRFISDDTVESYFDSWHFNEKEIADSGSVWATEPWEISAAVERLVVSGNAAYSRTEESVKGVPWISLILPAHAAMIRAELQEMKNEGFVPPALRDFVTVEQAADRYDASIGWIGEHNHAVISNGPFFIDRYNVEGKVITVKAFRDPTYPFEQGHWASYQDPALARITNIDAPGSFVIGQPSAIDAYVTVADQPSNDAVVNYFVSDGSGNVILKGEATPGSPDGRFAIEFGQNDTALLSPGPNTIKIFATSNAALRPNIMTATIIAASAQPGATGSNNSSNNTAQAPTETTAPASPSGCLIATAAFGSELTPQVQYLRNFRQNYILSTASGSAFMNTFNTVYYSFSPQVADFERDQPWLQQTVKAGLYPLFGILTLSEKSHNAVGGGEAGSVISGLTAASLIGAVYLSPVAALATRLSRSGARTNRMMKILVMVTGAAAAVIVIGLFAGDQTVMPISTASFVILAAATSAIAVSSAAWWIWRKFEARKKAGC